MSEIRRIELAGFSTLAKNPPFTTDAAICPHGMWTDSSSFEPLFTTHNHREHNIALYAPDLPGHGKSPGDISQMRMEDYADAVIRCTEALREQGARRVALVGHSMGGLISQMAAPEAKPDAMVLAMSGAPGGMTGNFGFALAKCIAWYLFKMYSGKPFKPRLEDVELVLGKGGFDQESLTRFHERLIPESGHAAWQMFRSKMKIDPSPCPTLVIAGRQDFFLPIPGQQKLAKFHNAEYLELDVGHLPLEEPHVSLVSQKIFDWLLVCLNGKNFTPAD